MTFSQIKTFYPDLKDIIADDAEILRKSAQGVIGVEGDYTLGIACTPNTDREGDIIDPMGVCADFYAGEMFFAHQFSDQISPSKAVSWEIKPEAITLKIKHFLDQELGRDIFNGVRSGAIRALSITVKPKQTLQRGTRAFIDYVEKHKLAKYVTDATKRIVTKCDWIETSWAPVPMNPACVVTGITSKSLTCESKQMQTFLGMDKPDTKALLETTEKLIETERALNESRMALESIQTKAMTLPVVTKAAAPVPNPALLNLRGFIDSLKTQETDLTDKLNEVWTEAGTQIQGIDISKPVADVTTEVSDILSGAGSKADALIRTQVEGMADQVFAGYRTGYDGVTPIKDIAKVDAWRNQFVEDYLKTIPENQTLADYKKRVEQALANQESIPTLDMTASNAATANISSFGAQKDILSNLLKESGSGDIVQVQGLDDEKLCSGCEPFLDQFLSVSGTSDNFDSVDSAKAGGWGHINCRCVLVPTVPPAAESKSVTEIETKAVKVVPVEIIPEVKVPIKVTLIRKGAYKAVMTPELLDRARMLAAGRLV